MLTPEEYAARHREAFRAAFDYLNNHFPPGTDDVYWKATDLDGSLICAKGKDNPLLPLLMTAVVDYLEKESKLRRKEYGDTTPED